MVTILHRELERKVEKVKMLEVTAKDQKQYEFPAWINHNWSVHVNCLWRMEGRGKGGGDLIVRGGLLTFFLW